jgi:thiol:disulfide interchange protein DsbD
MVSKLVNIIFSIFVALIVAMPCQAELSDDQAFNLGVRIVDNNRLELKWEIAAQHYLYQNQIVILDADNKSLLQTDTLPTGTTIEDATLGKYVVYDKQLIINLPWQESTATQKLIVRYQGCLKDGFCYLPISKMVSVTGEQIDIETTTLQEFPTVSTADKLAETINNRFLPVTLIIFFCLGILLSFTPCVLPMIPLVVNLIIGTKPISTHKALVLSTSYVLGMAGSYTVAGVIAGMLGATLQTWLQQPFVIVSLSILLVILALSQFDLIHVKLPHFNNRVHHWGQKQLQGSVPGAFILGILSALIVSPCITPPLIGALTYISQNGNPLIGGLTLLSLGLGMGVPLIIVALLSNVILPKAGAWMNLVKTIAGVALLGLAIWLLSRIIPPYITVMLWGSLCIISAAFLKTFEPLKSPKRSTRILKALGIILAISGAVLIVNAIDKQFHPGRISTDAAIKWKYIDSKGELETSLAAAKAKQQVTILEVYADWCTSCKKIEATVFTNSEIIATLQQFNLLKIDMTASDVKKQELLAALEIYGPPSILFFNSDGVEIKSKRVVGEISEKAMLGLLQELKR